MKFFELSQERYVIKIKYKSIKNLVDFLIGID
jgi:hypothetical protein